MRARTSSRPSPLPYEPDGFAGSRVVVMGLGRFGGGVGVARWLAMHGADVVVTDLADERSLRASIESLSDCDIKYHLGKHDISDLEGIDLLVVSPAVHKERSAYFQEVLRRGIPWTTEINLFLERCPARIVGITGTAGKSTTSAMLHAILKRGGRFDTYLGGNIGGSLLDAVAKMSRDDTVVLELSSFQLDSLPRIARRPDVAVFVSFWPHHLDRHVDAETYVDCKLNLVRGAAPDTDVVWGVEDADLTARLQAVAGQCTIHTEFGESALASVVLKTPGDHNRHNAACAMATARILGVGDDVSRAALEAFPGLPHRLQFVATRSGVAYYNDSKSTTGEATVTALQSFDKPVVLLVGGQARPGDCHALASSIVNHARVAICFGTAGTVVHDAIQRSSPHSCRFTACHTPRLEDAIRTAESLARSDDVILLSPGFPSYDAFANYERRGEVFISLVEGSHGVLERGVSS